MKYAYVTLVMRGDNYTPGALTLAHSLRRTGTKHDLVCMVTDDVEGVEALAQVFDHVKLVTYLTYNTWPRWNKKSEARYGPWMSMSLTKYRCLEFAEYDKIFFLDADVLVHRNMDCVFKLRTPGGTFSNTGKAHGEMIYPTDVENMARGKFYTCVASSLLLSPGVNVYSKFLAYLNKSYREQNNMLGIKDMKSGIDEQLIAFFYSFRLGLNWTNIGNSFQSCWWVKPDPTMQPPFLTHYVKEIKPWEDNSRHREWWDVAGKVINSKNRRFFDVRGSRRRIKS